MIVRNWMKPNPITVVSDTLVSDPSRISRGQVQFDQITGQYLLSRGDNAHPVLLTILLVCAIGVTALVLAMIEDGAITKDLSLRDPARVFRFLASTGRLDLPRASWMEKADYLEHRAGLIVRELVHRKNPKQDVGGLDRVWLQSWLHANADMINADGRFPFLNAAKRELAQLGHLRVDEIRSDFRFLVVRAKPDHPDAWLTNRLISDFVPSDFLSRYVFNKQGFYADYAQFDAVWQRYVVDTLKSTYLSDKDGFRARLYGLED